MGATKIYNADTGQWEFVGAGPKGETGDTGPAGPANSLSVAATNTLSPGSNATVTVGGTAPSQTLTFGIPQGAVGPANTLSVAATNTVSPGTNASVTIAGTAPTQSLTFNIPQGATGATGATGPTGADVTYPFTFPGLLSARVGTTRLPMRSTGTYQITDVRAMVGTAPTGTTLLTIDVNKNGTTIYTTQTNRIIFTASATSATGGTINVTNSFTGTDYITIDIDSVGSTTAGADLTVLITLTRIA